jgi:hypothetical protein
MPYKSVDELPAQFNKYSANGRKAALQTFNNVYAGKSSESKAFASAHAAAKRADSKPAKKAKGKSSRVKPTTRFNDATTNNGAT